MNTRGLEKVRFDLTNAPNRADLPDNLSGETVWAEPIGERLYRLRNSPAFANGFADEDTVECIVNPRSGCLEVSRLAADGGNGTVRVYFRDSEAPAALAVIDELKSVGCHFERASSALVLFVVPPRIEVPFPQLLNYLDSVVSDEVIGWEIGKAPGSRP
jgi:hypothetical protein